MKWDEELIKMNKWRIIISLRRMDSTVHADSQKFVDYLLNDLRQISNEAKKRYNYVKEVFIDVRNVFWLRNILVSRVEYS